MTNGTVSEMNTFKPINGSASNKFHTAAHLRFSESSHST